MLPLSRDLFNSQLRMTVYTRNILHQEYLWYFFSFYSHSFDPVSVFILLIFFLLILIFRIILKDSIDTFCVRSVIEYTLRNFL